MMYYIIFWPRLILPLYSFPLSALIFPLYFVVHVMGLISSPPSKKQNISRQLQQLSRPQTSTNTIRI